MQDYLVYKVSPIVFIFLNIFIGIEIVFTFIIYDYINKFYKNNKDIKIQLKLLLQKLKKHTLYTAIFFKLSFIYITIRNFKLINNTKLRITKY